METTIKTATNTWSLDKAHAKTGFTSMHMLVSEVEGFFRSFDATLKTAGDDFSGAKVEFTAEVKSIDTHNEQRDAHLQAPDFFDAAQFPQVKFSSKSFIKTGDNTYNLNGDLTIRNITRNIDLSVKAASGENPFTKKKIAGFKLTGEIKRNDFGVGASVPSFVVGETIHIIANAEFVAE